MNEMRQDTQFLLIIKLVMRATQTDVHPSNNQRATLMFIN